MSPLLRFNSCQSLQNQDSGEMEQPAPPAFVQFQGVNYELHSTESVRRNLNPSGDGELGVVTETILDLETSQKSSVCLVTFLLPGAQTFCSQRLGKRWEPHGR